MGRGASSLSVPWRKHVASTAQARGAALVPLQVGGGLPFGSRRRPSYPVFAPPVPPPLGLARRVLPTGTVVWSVPHPLSAASPPCRFVLGGGGGGGAVRPSLPSSPTLGGGEVCGGGGACRLPFVARMSQARRKHGAGTRRGTCPSAGGGGACLVAPVVALPTLRSHPRWSPRWDLHGACYLRARSCGPSRTLSPLPPPPAALSSGGAPLFAPPYLHPPSLGGRRCVGGGGGRPCRLPFVARTSQARRKHGARTRRGTCPSVGGGGLPCVTRRRPSYPACAPPGGRWCVGGLGRPCRRPFVARMWQARRKHNASTG